MKRRNLAPNALFAFLGDAAGKLATLGALAVASRATSTAEFARIATVLAAAGIITAALDLGAQTLIARDGAGDAPARAIVFRALALARLPFLLAALAAGVLFGLASGRPVEALAAVLLGITGAATLSLSGVARAAQDLVVEARARGVGGVLSVAAVAAVALFDPHPPALLAALVVASCAPLVVFWRAARGGARFVAGLSPRRALVRALPVGLIALATIGYYRSGTVALAALSNSRETSRFAIASTVAFGLLAFANAVTTALLPRLSAEQDRDERVRCARRALRWTCGLALVLAGFTALFAKPGLSLVFGARYGDAALPLAILALATALIAPAGIIGTALFADGQIRVLGGQVAVSLAANLVALALLVPPLGATGAALATVVCELAGIVVLVRPAARLFPGLFALPRLARRVARAPSEVRL